LAFVTGVATVHSLYDDGFGVTAKEAKWGFLKQLSQLRDICSSSSFIICIAPPRKFADVYTDTLSVAASTWRFGRGSLSLWPNGQVEVITKCLVR
jgi:hypothetical protein